MGTQTSKNKQIINYILIFLVALMLGFFGSGLFTQTGGSLSGAAGALADAADCDMSPLSGPAATGIVLADPLNFRTGPGLNYQVITVLQLCTPISLEGRTNDSTWLQVKVPGGAGGWVYSSYVQANINKKTLDVTTGAGGPVTSGGSPSGGSSSISVSIEGGKAYAYVYGMPANTTVNATLSPSSGAGKSVVVTSGTTNPNGDLVLNFTMPTTWADGSGVKSGSLTLTVSGGGASMTAYITYYTN